MWGIWSGKCIRCFLTQPSGWEDRKCPMMRGRCWRSIRKWQVWWKGKGKWLSWSWRAFIWKASQNWRRLRELPTGTGIRSRRIPGEESRIWVRFRLSTKIWKNSKTVSFITSRAGAVRSPAATVSPRSTRNCGSGIWNWSKRNYSFSWIITCHR